MAKEETKKPPRRSWRDVLAERNPDLNIDDEQDVGDYMTDQFSQFDEGERQRKSFNDMLAGDERTAGLLTGLATGMDENGEEFSLAGYLLKNYGDIIRDAADEEDAVKKAKEREAETIKKAADEAKRKETLDAALKKTDEALTEAVNSANVDDATAQAMLAWLYGDKEGEGLVHRIIRHELDAEDWSKLLFAFNRDNSLSAAREEGRKSGAKGRAANAHRNFAAPTDLGGGGGTEQVEETIEDPTLKRYQGMKRKFQ
jgi:hypothetical protein